MSETKFFCERCGHDSDDPVTCTHCGRPIEATPMDWPPSAPDGWGRLKVRLKSPADSERTWNDLAPLWRAKEDPWRWPEPRQWEQFEPGSDTIEFYGPESLVPRIEELLQGRGTIEFEDLQPEQFPWYTPPDPKAWMPDWYLERRRQRDLKKKQ